MASLGKVQDDGEDGSRSPRSLIEETHNPGLTVADGLKTCSRSTLEAVILAVRTQATLITI